MTSCFAGCIVSEPTLLFVIPLLQNTWVLSHSNRWRYKSVRREWAPVLGQPLYFNEKKKTFFCYVLHTFMKSMHNFIENYFKISLNAVNFFKTFWHQNFRKIIPQFSDNFSVSFPKFSQNLNRNTGFSKYFRGKGTFFVRGKARRLYFSVHLKVLGNLLQRGNIRSHLSTVSSRGSARGRTYGRQRNEENSVY